MTFSLSLALSHPSLHQELSASKNISSLHPSLYQELSSSKTMSSSGSTEKRKPSDEPITLKVNGQNTATLLIGIKLDCQMQKLMDAYGKKRQLDPNTFEFLCGDNGLRIQKRDTPRKLGLGDGYEILAMFHQNGGGFK